MNRIKCLLGHGLLVVGGTYGVAGLAVALESWLKAFTVVGMTAGLYVVLGWAVWQVLGCWERR
jgi:hypothetical protein